MLEPRQEVIGINAMKNPVSHWKVSKRGVVGMYDGKVKF